MPLSAPRRRARGVACGLAAWSASKPDLRDLHRLAHAHFEACKCLPQVKPSEGEFGGRLGRAHGCALSRGIVGEPRDHDPARAASWGGSGPLAECLAARGASSSCASGLQLLRNWAARWGQWREQRWRTGIRAGAGSRHRSPLSRTSGGSSGGCRTDLAFKLCSSVLTADRCQSHGPPLRSPPHLVAGHANIQQWRAAAPPPPCCCRCC